MPIRNHSTRPRAPLASHTPWATEIISGGPRRGNHNALCRLLCDLQAQFSLYCKWHRQRRSFSFTRKGIRPICSLVEELLCMCPALLVSDGV